jgi:phosphatidylglycerophosphatase A
VRRIAIAIATGLGVGFAPVAPATVASFLVALLMIPAVGHVTPLAWGLVTLALFPVAVWSSHEAEKTLGTHRSQSLPGGWGVVVDDVLAGVLTNVALRVLVGWVSP